MPNADDILWFKQQFAADIEPAVTDTPFDLDMLAALACQETGEIWPMLRRQGIARDEILRLCVGDTLDRPKTFPKNRADLCRVNRGSEMFAAGHQLLVDMAQHIKGYAKVATNPDKFCHGYGIFQYDIQAFAPATIGFFLGGYATFEVALQMCLSNLREKMKRIGFDPAKPLNDLQMAAVAIAYNTGSYKPAKGLQQGYRPPGGRYYGEMFFDYLKLAHTVAVPGGAPPVLAPAGPGVALVPPPRPVSASGQPYLVATEGGNLNVRDTPEKNAARPNVNVVASLPSGQPVMVVDPAQTHGFVRIETSFKGALIHGWCSFALLAPAPGVTMPLPVAPIPVAPTDGIVAVDCPPRAGVVTKRTAPADAFSLNEPDQPGRTGTDAATLRAEIATIIDWLAVDTPAHKRYQPGSGRTYCNIYAHDFCHLAGVYLPRVWWSQAAIADLARGRIVSPRYGETIDEQRANDLFRWLRDWGERFGWRRTQSLTDLQLAADSGGIGLIVARRKEDGRSGHIVVIVPESPAHAARWGAGAVTAPLQSQAGSVNFQYGAGKTDWWRDDRFAEFAFWVHA